MSEYRLNTYVHAVEYDDKGARTGREQLFGPDDDMSAKDNEWALASISNPDVWVEGKAPKERPAPPAPQDEVAALKARIAQLEQEKAASGTGAASGDVEPDAAEVKDDAKPAPRRQTSGKSTQ